MECTQRNTERWQVKFVSILAAVAYIHGSPARPKSSGSLLPIYWKGNVVGGRVAEVEKDMFDIHSGGVVARVKRIFCWFV